MLRINPEDADAHFNLGIAYRKSGKCQEAIEAYKQAIRINPDFAMAHDNPGLAYTLISAKIHLDDILSIHQKVRVKKYSNVKIVKLIYND